MSRHDMEKLDQFVSDLQSGVIAKPTSPHTEDKGGVEILNKSLRSLFLFGNPTENQENPVYIPITMLLQKQKHLTARKFPVIWDVQKSSMYTLLDYLDRVCQDYLPTAQDKELKKWSEEIVDIVNEELRKKDGQINFDYQIKEAFHTLLEAGENGEISEVNLKLLTNFRDYVLSKNAILINPRKSLTLQVFDHYFLKQKEKSQQFRNKIKKYIDGIRELLLLHQRGQASQQNEFDFASDLLAMDKVEDLSSTQVTAHLTDERIRQLQKALETLLDNYQSFMTTVDHVFVDKVITKKFAVKSLLNNCVITEVAEGDLVSMREKSRKIYQKYIATVAAMRLAEIEINHQYDSALHLTYFKNFDENYLGPEDLMFLPRILFLVDSSAIPAQIGELLSMLSEKEYLKIIAITTLDSFTTDITKLDHNSNILDLSTLVMARHTTSVFQVGESDPLTLASYLEYTIDTDRSVFGHFLIAENHTDAEKIAIDLAVQSRLFPKIKYRVEKAHFQDRFDLKDNFQYGEQFVKISEEIKLNSSVEKQVCDLTMADFFCLLPEMRSKFTVLPENYHDDHLVLLPDYLSTSYKSELPTIPYIRVINDQGNHQKVIIPVVLVSFIRNRMELWKMLREQDMVSDDQVQQAMLEAESVWKIKNEKEIKELREELQKSFEKSRNQDLERALYKILLTLLDGDVNLMQLASGHRDTSQEINISTNIVPEVRTAEEHLAEEESREEINPQAWIETDECTSCNDCINTAPSVFAYNEDKQAYVKNPKGAPYAKIVAAAEKCPARCIHPGLPHDKQEDGLEKWIKRAEKYN